MKRRIALIVALAAANSLCLALISDLMLLRWPNSPGVHLGVTLHYLWIFLSLQGGAALILFCILPPMMARALSVGLVLGIGGFLYPGGMNPAYLAVVTAAAILCCLPLQRLLTARHNR